LNLKGVKPFFFNSVLKAHKTSHKKALISLSRRASLVFSSKNATPRFPALTTGYNPFQKNHPERH
jgi:hypothetical protein